MEEHRRELRNGQRKGRKVRSTRPGEQRALGGQQVMRANPAEAKRDEAEQSPRILMPKCKDLGVVDGEYAPLSRHSPGTERDMDIQLGREFC